MKVITDFHIVNGVVEQQYSITRDQFGDAMLRYLMDPDGARIKIDMHIEPAAFYPLAMAFLALAAEFPRQPIRVDIPAPAENVVSFRKIVPGAARVRVEGVV